MVYSCRVGFISGVYSNRTKGVQMCSDHFPNPEPLTLSVTLSQTATRTTRWGVRRDWFAVGTTAPSSIRFPQPPASPDHRTVARVSVDAELPGCRVPFARIDKGCIITYNMGRISMGRPMSSQHHHHHFLSAPIPSMLAAARKVVPSSGSK